MPIVKVKEVQRSYQQGTHEVSNKLRMGGGCIKRSVQQ